MLSGREFRTNSILAPDSKKKLYINLDSGLWTDFKAGESGHFYQLVSLVDNISEKAAESYVKRMVFDSGVPIFDVPIESSQKQPEISNFKNIADDVKLFEKINPIKDINSKSFLKRLASRFAFSRCLEGFKFYVARAGTYANRIIIPYSDDDGVFYFQARTLLENSIKYLNPNKAVYGIKTSEIMFPFNENLEYVLVTEGPLDAMSIQAAGINATCTQGCKMSRTQAQTLKTKKVILAYDNDKPGRKGFLSAKKRLLSTRNSNIYSVTPPKEYNDWNEFLVADGKTVLSEYIQNNIMKADFDLTIIERLA